MSQKYLFIWFFLGGVEIYARWASREVVQEENCGILLSLLLLSRCQAKKKSRFGNSAKSEI